MRNLFKEKFTQISSCVVVLCIFSIIPFTRTNALEGPSLQHTETPPPRVRGIEGRWLIPGNNSVIEVTCKNSPHDIEGIKVTIYTKSCKGTVVVNYLPHYKVGDIVFEVAQRIIWGGSDGAYVDQSYFPGFEYPGSRFPGKEYKQLDVGYDSIKDELIYVLPRERQRMLIFKRVQ